MKNAKTRTYKMDSVEELMEYMWLRPKVTHLNVDIFVARW